MSKQLNPYPFSTDTLLQCHFQIVFVHVLALLPTVIWFALPTISAKLFRTQGYRY